MITPLLMGRANSLPAGSGSGITTLGTSLSMFWKAASQSNVEGEERQSFGPGEVYHEALNRVMQARNLSTTERTKILSFQVGDKGEPLMIKAR